MSDPNGAAFDPAAFQKARNANFQKQTQSQAAAGIFVSQKPSMLMTGVVALAGATAAGVYLIGGNSASDFATSFTGSLGAATGFAIGSYLDTTDEVMKYSSKSMMPVWPVVGAVAVPALAAGALDSDVAILAAGAWAGAYAYNYYQNYQSN